MTKAKCILYIPEKLYYYRCNLASVIQNVDLQSIPGMISNHVFELVYEYMARWNMMNAQTKEAIAVCYLRNYMAVYYKLRRLCRDSALRRKFRSFKWNQVLCMDAFQYASSKRLTAKEKMKLFVARYVRIL